MVGTPLRCNPPLTTKDNRSPDSPDAWASCWSAVRDGASPPDDLLVAYLPRLQAFVRAKAGGAVGPAESRSDVVASVCAEFLKRRDDFEFTDEPSFRAWLFTAAANKLRDYFRHRHAQKRAPDREIPLGSDADHLLLRGYASVATPSRNVAAREQVDLLERAIDALEPDQREVVAHVRLACLTVPETAKALDRSEGSVRGLLARGLLKLSSELKRLGLEASSDDA